MLMTLPISTVVMIMAKEAQHLISSINDIFLVSVSVYIIPGGNSCALIGTNNDYDLCFHVVCICCWYPLFISLCCFCLSSTTDKTFIGHDYMPVYEQHGGCLIRRRNCLPFASTWVHFQFLVRSMLIIFVVFDVVLCFFVLFVFVLCLVCPMLPVSLDFPFLIVPSVSPNT